jgi:long-subunit fatty acid transport protein
VRIPWPRDTLQFTAQHARRDTRFAGITTGTARDDTTIAAAGSWERRLTQVISSATTLSYSDTRSEQDGSASGDARTWTARVGLSWDINETLRAGAGIAHLRRDVSGPRFQPSEFSGSYDENVVFATLRKTF